MDIPVFIGVTVILFGFAAYMTGQATATTWRKSGWVVLYALMLGLADRFIVWSLFGGNLLSVPGYITDTLALAVIGLIGFRLTQVRRMVRQYPWLYQQSSPFTWRRIDGA